MNLHFFERHFVYKSLTSARQARVSCVSAITSQNHTLSAIAVMATWIVWSGFDETSLPSKEHFFNRLYDKHKQSTYARRVWEMLKCNTMKDYHNHYLITDILLLVDVFENFRKMSLETYGLDPIHYYSLPGLSWDTMLKYTGVELELIINPDMHLMVEESMCPGISNICHRHATSNYPSMDTYNENEEPRTLTCQDANSLYSWAMLQMLPLKCFKWTSSEG